MRELGVGVKYIDKRESIDSVESCARRHHAAASSAHFSAQPALHYSSSSSSSGGGGGGSSVCTSSAGSSVVSTPRQMKAARNPSAIGSFVMLARASRALRALIPARAFATQQVPPPPPPHPPVIKSSFPALICRLLCVTPLPEQSTRRWCAPAPPPTHHHTNAVH